MGVKEFARERPDGQTEVLCAINARHNATQDMLDRGSCDCPSWLTLAPL